jgi:hypothetical protein
VLRQGDTTGFREGRAASRWRRSTQVPAEPLEIVAAVLFALALAHTFSAKQFARLAHHFPRHAGLLHLLGEVEVIFGFWAIVLVFTMASWSAANARLSTPNRATIGSRCLYSL